MSKGRKNDSSKNVITLADNFKATAKLKTEILEIQQFCEAQTTTIQKLSDDLQKKEDEISHLKSMLGKTVPVIGNVQRIICSEEEEIAVLQLNKLRATARVRDLTLEETKKFDLFVKNKRLAQGDVTSIEGNYKSLPGDVSPAELLSLASSSTDVEKEKRITGDDDNDG